MKDRLKEILLEKSFKVGKFKLASGKTSDYYVDGRVTTLDSEGAFLIGSIFLEKITEWGADKVGGLTLGADPIVGAVIALSHQSGKPVGGFIVRKKTKDHGTGKLVEGTVGKGNKAIVVEDVVTSGGSALQAVEAVRNQGAEVVGVLAVVDREDGGREAILETVPNFEALFTATELKQAAKQQE